MASSTSSLSSPRPTIQARRDHPEAAMATPSGSPQTWCTTDHEDSQMKDVPYRLRRQKSEILRAQYTDVREIRFSVGTWNVGGICPPSDLDIQEWLDMEEPVDIYVLGFQEIIPLEAGYIIGAEDNIPVAVWEHIIGETLNKKCPDKMRFKCHSAPPSPSRFNPPDYALAIDDELLSESDNDSDGELHLLNEQDSNVVINNSGVSDKTCKNPTSASSKRLQKANDLSSIPAINTFDHYQELGFEKLRSTLEDPTNQPKLTKLLSHSKRSEMIWSQRPLDMLANNLMDSARSSTTARLLQPLDLACDDNIVERKRPQFVRIMSKQMVGIFLSIWVRRNLRKHIQNLRVSILGVGEAPYIGNKGSISVSMSIYQTHFCFVCCHLAAGEKEGDELKRNAHVEQIHRRTVFNPVPAVRVPQRIHDHERIIWLGDLNYRINLSYEMTLELISKQDWDRLFENDQLKKEMRKGCAFDGWVEGIISFPPTYKYEFNLEKYVSDATKSGRRTPSWCDRILSYGKGIKLLSYKRAELTFSDHRPVTAVYTVEVEGLHHKKLQRALAFTNGEVEDNLLLRKGSNS